MSSTRAKPRAARAEILQKLAQVGRENSDATIFFHSAMARRLGLNPTDEKAMSVLERVGPLSAGQIAQHTGLATASVTDLLDRLERKGFIQRVRDPADRRRIIVEPVAGRIAEAARLFVSLRQSVARLYGKYSDAELAVIADFLASAAEMMRAETAKLEADPR